MNKREVLFGTGALALIGVGASCFEARRMGSMAGYNASAAATRRALAANPQMRDLVRFATLAPNGHNTQPWRFQVREREIAILPDFARRSSIRTITISSLASVRLQKISPLLAPHAGTPVKPVSAQRAMGLSCSPSAAKQGRSPLCSMRSFTGNRHAPSMMGGLSWRRIYRSWPKPPKHPVLISS